MELKLSLNSKLKKDGIDSFPLPAGFTEGGRKICIGADSCLKLCYARQGTYRFKGSIKVREENFILSQKNTFVKDMISLYQKSKRKIHRIHDSGDFYSMQYLHKWLSIANELQDHLFYAYTKSIPLLDYDIIPKNLRIIQSFGGKYDSKIDLSKPHAKVFFSEKKLLESGYNDASISDLVAIKNDRIGLVYHGNKKAKKDDSFLNK